jgi:branched-subunit amino acid aminotransferase/4-amino-4-deoxychorismate lyase
VARLTNSCRALGRTPPSAGLLERLSAQASGELVLRVTIDGRGERIEPRPVPPAEPMRVVVSGTRHEPYPHKSTDRAVFDRARTRVVPYRADEAILLTGDGMLAEGCVTNVFFWLGEQLCTPSLEVGVLPGVGRARVIELAGERKIPVREGLFPRPEVEGLPLFLVNAVRGVVETIKHGDWRRQKDDRTLALAEGFWG